MATPNSISQEMNRSPLAVNSELLEEMLGHPLPAGVLGVILSHYKDCEEDEITMIYVVYEDAIDLDSHDGVPDLDYLKILGYTRKHYPGRIAMTRTINLKEVSEI